MASAAPRAGRGVIALGAFDGMHRGHAKVISTAVASARHHGLPSVLVLLDPPPDQRGRPDPHRLVLTTIARRAELAARLGIEVVRVLPFSRALACLAPAEFARQVLAGQLEAAEVVAGADFRFGAQAAGSAADLARLAGRFGFAARIVEMVREGDTVISASWVRSRVEAGDVTLARLALGRPHRIDGLVEHGDHRGRTLGFPTANLRHHRLAAVPADGVYAGRVVLLGEPGQAGQPAPLGAAAISVGSNRTFGGRQRRVEAHILDVDRDLYGRRIGVEFTRRLRGMTRFDSVPALIAQIRLDVEQVRRPERAAPAPS